MVRIHKTYSMIIGSVLTLVTCYGAQAETPGLQGVLGVTQFADDSIKVDGLGVELEGGTKLPSLITLGGIGHHPVWGGRNSASSAGFEYGLLLSYGVEDTDTRSINGTVLVNIESSILLGDLFAGLYVSQTVGNGTRLYAGAGPSLMLGRISGDFEEKSGNTLDLVDETETAFGVGGYVRAGIELPMKEGSTFGIGVRAFTASLDFDDTYGDIEFTGVQGFITLTQGI